MRFIDYDPTKCLESGERFRELANVPEGYYWRYATTPLRIMREEYSPESLHADMAADREAKRIRLIDCGFCFACSNVGACKNNPDYDCEKRADFGKMLENENNPYWGRKELVANDLFAASLSPEEFEMARKRTSLYRNFKFEGRRDVWVQLEAYYQYFPEIEPWIKKVEAFRDRTRKEAKIDNPNIARVLPYGLTTFDELDDDFDYSHAMSCCRDWSTRLEALNETLVTDICRETMTDPSQYRRKVGGLHGFFSWEIHSIATPEQIAGFKMLIEEKYRSECPPERINEQFLMAVRNF